MDLKLVATSAAKLVLDRIEREQTINIDHVADEIHRELLVRLGEKKPLAVLGSGTRKTLYPHQAATIKEMQELGLLPRINPADLKFETDTTVLTKGFRDSSDRLISHGDVARFCPSIEDLRTIVALDGRGCLKVAQALTRAFTWDKSSQGYKYWHDQKSNIDKGLPLAQSALDWIKELYRVVGANGRSPSPVGSGYEESTGSLTTANVAKLDAIIRSGGIGTGANASYLSGAFSWSGSPQGVTYWNDRHLGLLAGKRLPVGDLVWLNMLRKKFGAPPTGKPIVASGDAKFDYSYVQDVSSDAIMCVLAGDRKSLDLAFRWQTCRYPAHLRPDERHEYWEAREGGNQKITAEDTAWLKGLLDYIKENPGHWRK